MIFKRRKKEKFKALGTLGWAAAGNFQFTENGHEAPRGATK